MGAQGENGEGRVVIYTRRAHLLRYYSPIRNRVISLRWKEEWHIDDDHVVFPASVGTAEQVLDNYCGPRLLPAERKDIWCAIQRVLCARDALKAEAGLHYTPRCVTTSISKNVSLVCSHLGLPLENTFLWDDNVELKDAPHVLLTGRYAGMASAEHAELIAYLKRVLPAASLPEEARCFLFSASEYHSSCLAIDRNGVAEWRVPWTPQRPAPFALPPTSAFPPKPGPAKEEVTDESEGFPAPPTISNTNSNWSRRDGFRGDGLLNDLVV